MNLNRTLPLLDLYKRSEQTPNTQLNILGAIGNTSYLAELAKMAEPEWSLNLITNIPIPDIENDFRRIALDALGMGSVPSVAKKMNNPTCGFADAEISGFKELMMRHEQNALGLSAFITESMECSSETSLQSLVVDSLERNTLRSDLLSLAIGSELNQARILAEQVESTLCGSAVLFNDYALRSEKELEQFFSQITGCNLASMLADSAAEQSLYKSELFANEMESDLLQAKVLAEQTRMNLLDASALLQEFQFPDITNFIEEMKQNSLTHFIDEIDQWHLASSRLAETARAFCEVPFDIREQWINDFEDEEINTDKNRNEPRTAADVSESLEEEAENIRKRKIPKGLLKLLKDPRTIAAIASFILNSEIVINIDNSTTINNIQPQFNLNLTENKSIDGTEVTFGRIKTKKPNSEVYVRKGPGLHFKKDATLIPNNTIVTVLATKKQWAKVSLIHNEQPIDGWIALKLIKFFEPRSEVH